MNQLFVNGLSVCNVIKIDEVQRLVFEVYVCVYVCVSTI